MLIVKKGVTYEKTISIMLTIALLFAIGTTAFAFDDDVPSVSPCEPDKSISANPNRVSDGNLVSFRSTSLPTQYWNLARNDYNADLKLVGKSWLYTNVYYYPNGDGKIFVSYDVSADVSTTYLYVGLYDLTQGELVVETSWDIEVRTTGTSGGLNFYNLIQSHKYAVCFRAHPSSLNGSAIISHTE